MQYRRDYLKGACYFFTVVTYMRRPILAEPSAIDKLREAIRREMKRRPSLIEAMAIMPDHIHALWTLPENDADYSIRWRNIKSSFTANIPEHERPNVNASRIHKAEQAVWQRRFWEHRIRDEQDFNRHVDYIHYNPVKHGYVRSPGDWPYSSIHRYVEKGVLPCNWGATPILMDEKTGME